MKAAPAALRQPSHLSPAGKPAPPRPRKAERFIASMRRWRPSAIAASSARPVCIGSASSAPHVVGDLEQASRPEVEWDAAAHEIDGLVDARRRQARDGALVDQQFRPKVAKAGGLVVEESIEAHEPIDARRRNAKPGRRLSPRARRQLAERALRIAQDLQEIIGIGAVTGDGGVEGIAHRGLRANAAPPLSRATTRLCD